MQPTATRSVNVIHLHLQQIRVGHFSHCVVRRRAHVGMILVDVRQVGTWVKPDALIPPLPVHVELAYGTAKWRSRMGIHALVGPLLPGLRYVSPDWSQR